MLNSKHFPRSRDQSDLTFIVILGCETPGFSISCCAFFFLLCLCDFVGDLSKSGEYRDRCFSFLRFLFALYVAISEDRLASVVSMEVSIALLSLSITLFSAMREENEELGERNSSFLAGAPVEAFEFSLCESLGLSATMGVIDIRGVFVRVGDVKLRFSFFDCDSSPIEPEECSLSLDFFIFLSFFLRSELSFSLLNSNGFIFTLIGDWFSDDMVVRTLIGFSFSFDFSFFGGESVLEGLGGSCMMAPSLL